MGMYTKTFAHVVVLACLSLFIYIFTIHGHYTANDVTNVDPNFMNNINKLGIDMKQNYKSPGKLTNIQSMHETLIEIIYKHPYISEIYIISKRGNCMISRKRDLLEFNELSSEYDIQTRSEWFSTTLGDEFKWSQPYYSNKNSDRSYNIHYTFNIESMDDGGVEAIVNFTCNSKLRKRKQIL